jgi:hypothetical protein
MWGPPSLRTSPPSGPEVKNAWFCNFAPPYVTTAWCLITHRDNFVTNCSSCMPSVQFWFILSLCRPLHYFIRELFSFVLCVFIFVSLFLLHVFLILSLFRLCKPFVYFVYFFFIYLFSFPILTFHSLCVCFLFSLPLFFVLYPVYFYSVSISAYLSHLLSRSLHSRLYFLFSVSILCRFLSLSVSL